MSHRCLAGRRNHSRVSGQTRQRVLGPVDVHVNRPDRAARGLAPGKTGIIGVVRFGTNDFGPGQTFTGLERAVRARGYGLTRRNVDAPTPKRVQAAFDKLASPRSAAA